MEGGGACDDMSALGDPERRHGYHHLWQTTAII